MKAIGIKTSLPIQDKNSLIEFETEKPSPKGHEILVEIKAISVNPVDYKVRSGAAKNTVLETPKILGWDAAGRVAAVGEKVTLFKTGDEVFYAGDITKNGSNAAYQLVDERIVGHKPKKLADEEAAAIPLTGLTAFEAIFDRLNIKENEGAGKSILVIGGAGGVGSIAIQLLKKLTNLTVITTASRVESNNWCKKMDADVVIDHTDLVVNLKAAGYSSFDYILNFVNTDLYWQAMCELIKPQGKICCIVPPKGDLNVSLLFNKSASLHWELMFTRSSFTTEDIIRQHEILNTLADLFDQEKLQSILTTTLNGLTADNLIKAHQQLESGTTIGKIVIKV